MSEKEPISRTITSSRRRRKPTSNISDPINDYHNDKENQNNSALRLESLGKSPILDDGSFHRYTPLRQSLATSTVPFALPFPSDSTYQTVKNILRSIPPDLETLIVESSMIYPKMILKGQILLEEQKSEILNIVRRCIRSIGTSNDEKAPSDESRWIEKQLHIIAIHCLRAILPLILSSLNLESNSNTVAESMVPVIKILYHAISASESTDIMICLQGYHLLGVCLKRVLMSFSQCTSNLETFPTANSWQISLDPNLSLDALTKIVTHCILVMCIKIGELLQMDLENTETAQTIIHTMSRDGSKQMGPYECFQRILQELISKVYMSWVILPLRNIGKSTVTKDQLENMLSHSSRASKLLFEIASKLESRSQSVVCLSNVILELKGDAIMTLLLWYRNDDLKWRSSALTDQTENSDLTVSRCRNFDRACMMALKASSAYPQHSKRQNKLNLQAFHATVQIAFSEHAFLYGMNVSYADYYVSYSWASGSFEENRAILSHQSHPTSVILQVYHLAFSCIQQLKNNVRKEYVQKDLKKVMDLFQNTILLNDSVDMDILNLAYRVLSKMKFSQLLSERLASLENSSFANDTTTILDYTIANICGRCWGELNYKLYTKVEKDEKYLTFAIDAYLKTISIIERLNPKDSDASPYDLNESNSFIRRCHSICSLSFQNIPHIVTSVAKSLSNIAKRRGCFSSIMPQILSIDLFVRLGPSDSTLSARFLQFSSVLSDHNRSIESFGSLCMSLAFQAASLDQEELSSTKIQLEDVLLLCSDYVTGDMSTENLLGCRPLGSALSSNLNKLATLYLHITLNRSQIEESCLLSGEERSDLTDVLMTVVNAPKNMDSGLLKYFMTCLQIVKVSESIHSRLIFEFVQRVGVIIASATEGHVNLNTIDDICSHLQSLEFSSEKSVMIPSLYIVLGAQFRKADKLNGIRDTTRYTSHCVQRAEIELRRILEASATNIDKIICLVSLCCVVFHRSSKDECYRNRDDWDTLVINGTFSMMEYDNYIDTLDELVNFLLNINFQLGASINRCMNALLINVCRASHNLEKNSYGTCAIRLKSVIERLCKLDSNKFIDLLSATGPAIADAEFHGAALDRDSAIESVLKEIESLLKKFCKIIQSNCVETKTSSAEFIALVYHYGNLIRTMAKSLPTTYLHLFITKIEFAKSTYYVSPGDPIKVILNLWAYSCETALFDANVRIGNFITAFRNSETCCEIVKGFRSDAISKNLRRLDDSYFLSDYIVIILSKTITKTMWNRSIYNRSMAYLYVGDWKRAMKYITYLAESMNLIPRSFASSTKTTLHDFIHVMSSQCNHIFDLEVKTALAIIVSSSLTLTDYQGQMSEVFRTITSTHTSSAFNVPFIPSYVVKLDVSTLDWIREAIYLLLIIEERLPLPDIIQDDSNLRIDETISLYCHILNRSMMTKDRTLTLLPEANFTLTNFIASSINEYPSFHDVISLVVLRGAKTAMRGNYERESICIALKEIYSSQYNCALNKAEALYLESSIYIQDARNSGALFTLWYSEKSAECVDFTCVKKAKVLLNEALSLAGPPNLRLTREIMRSLALVSGPESLASSSDIKAGDLVHSSIGSTARQFAARNIGDQCELKDIFDAMDLPFIERTKRNLALKNLSVLCSETLSPNWEFIAFALCPGGEILKSTIKPSLDTDEEPFIYQTVAFFPSLLNCDTDPCSFTETIFQPFDDVIEKSRRQLSGLDEETASRRNSSKDEKVAYWEERQSIDANLSEILLRVDHVLGFLDNRKNMGLSKSNICEEDDDDDDDKDLCGNLAAKFEAVVLEGEDQHKCNNTAHDLNTLTVIELKELLTEKYGVSMKDIRSLRKKNLVDLAVEKINENVQDESEYDSDKYQSEGQVSKRDKACTFLILDESFTRLPMESLKVFVGRPVCRIPSLPFALSSMLRLNRAGVYIDSFAASKTSFVLDAESNLLKTQERIMATLSEVSESNGWNWKHTIGEKPSKSFIQDALKPKDGIFLYFGHSTGEKYFSRTDIEGLSKSNHGGHSDCNSVVILMGCSSAELVHANEMFEPEGAALSYLCAGAPTVVGNLWDVTDRDIDKFSTCFLQQFYGGQDDIATCVAKSRDACRMRNIVGCAPVVYGIPVSVLRR